MMNLLDTTASELRVPELAGRIVSEGTYGVLRDLAAITQALDRCDLTTVLLLHRPTLMGTSNPLLTAQDHVDRLRRSIVEAVTAVSPADPLDAPDA